MGILEWSVLGLGVVSLLNTIVLFGAARNVARLMENEVAKTELENEQWHARNVTYRDAHLANQAPPSDGLNISHLR